MNSREDFLNLTLANLDTFIADKQEENLHLEFKTVADPRLERDDRKNLAKAISGFANSDGGVVVWGIDTSTNSLGADLASAKREIAPLSQFIARLNQLTGEAANPSVGGVEHRKLLTTGDSGFAATYVPASDRGPHMAKCGEDRYYRRSGERFGRMEHFEIADMFGRRPQPKLLFHSRLSPGATGGGPEGSHRDVNVFLGLRNEGRGSAKAPYLALRVGAPYAISSYGIDGNCHFGLEQLHVSSDSMWDRFGGTEGRYVYPGTELEVATIFVSVFEKTQMLERIKIEYQFAADGVPVESGEICIRGRALLETAWPLENEDDT